MTFAIDTGPKPQVQQAIDPQEFGVNMWDPVRAERFKRKMILQVWAVDNEQDLENLLIVNDLTIDALGVSFPEYFKEVDDARTECLAVLRAKPQSRGKVGALTHSSTTGKVF